MNIGNQMTLLGLAALAYYAILLASGAVGIDVMPQFMVSAVLFLSSGRMMRKASLARLKKKSSTAKSQKERKEPDWALRTQILNWVMALLIISALGLWALKPVGVSFLEFLALD